MTPCQFVEADLVKTEFVSTCFRKLCLGNKKKNFQKFKYIKKKKEKAP